MTIRVNNPLTSCGTLFDLADNTPQIQLMEAIVNDDRATFDKLLPQYASTQFNDAETYLHKAIRYDRFDMAAAILNFIQPDAYDAVLQSPDPIKYFDLLLSQSIPIPTNLELRFYNLFIEQLGNNTFCAADYIEYVELLPSYENRGHDFHILNFINSPYGTLNYITLYDLLKECTYTPASLLLCILPTIYSTTDYRCTRVVEYQIDNLYTDSKITYPSTHYRNIQFKKAIQNKKIPLADFLFQLGANPALGVVSSIQADNFEAFKFLISRCYNLDEMIEFIIENRNVALLDLFLSHIPYVPSVLVQKYVPMMFKTFNGEIEATMFIVCSLVVISSKAGLCPFTFDINMNRLPNCTGKLILMHELHRHGFNVGNIPEDPENLDLIRNFPKIMPTPENIDIYGPRIRDKEGRGVAHLYAMNLDLPNLQLYFSKFGNADTILDKNQSTPFKLVIAQFKKVPFETLKPLIEFFLLQNAHNKLWNYDKYQILRWCEEDFDKFFPILEMIQSSNYKINFDDVLDPKVGEDYLAYFLTCYKTSPAKHFRIIQKLLELGANPNISVTNKSLNIHYSTRLAYIKKHLTEFKELIALFESYHASAQPTHYSQVATNYNRTFIGQFIHRNCPGVDHEIFSAIILDSLEKFKKKVQDPKFSFFLYLDPHNAPNLFVQPAPILFTALQFDRPEIVRYLLELGADSDEKIQYTPSHYIHPLYLVQSQINLTLMVNALTKKLKKPALDKIKSRALEYSIEYVSILATQLMLSNEFPITKKFLDHLNKEQNEHLLSLEMFWPTYLFKTIEFMDFSESFHERFFIGTSFNEQNELGKTYLMLAIHFRRKGWIERILNMPMDLNLKDNEGRTALSMAIELKWVDLVQKLLKMGASTLDQDYQALAARSRSQALIDLFTTTTFEPTLAPVITQPEVVKKKRHLVMETQTSPKIEILSFLQHERESIYIKSRQPSNSLKPTLMNHLLRFDSTLSGFVNSLILQVISILV